MLKRLLLLGSALLISGAIILTWAIHRTNLWGTQIANLVLARDYWTLLEEYYKTHHTYPETLALIQPDAPQNWGPFGLDAWGHPFNYTTDGVHFRLISYGRDNTPDGVDYSAMVPAGREYRRICGEWNADQVLTEHGFLSMCGK